MKQLTPMGLVKILALVTAIMVIPMVGGAVAGLVIDARLGTTPLYALVGLIVGSALSGIGIWLLIRTGARRGYARRGAQRDT